MSAIFRFGGYLRRLSSTRTYLSTIHGHAKQIINSKELYSIRPDHFICRCLATQNVQLNVKLENKGLGLDKALQRIDTTVRRIGRINLRDVEGICNEIKISGHATSTHCLMVIRCCGSLLPDELPEVRTALVNEIWSLMETLAIPLDVSHYNALLKVFLENEHKFSPPDFLAQMEKKGIAPNRVTYQRLITRYCQFGDIEGAGNILQYMKEKDLPINENVFNALILGHSRANDMESARSILQAMRTAKLEPSTDTYTALLYGFAENGDITSMKEILLEAENEEIHLFDKDYLDIIYALAKNGHANHVDEVISKLPKGPGFVQDAIITILRLVNCDQDDVALKLLKVLPQPSMSDGNAVASVNAFIRQLVRLERPIEKVLSVCEKMKQEGICSAALLVATERALFYGKAEHAVAFIKAMQEQGLPIRVHYFWPILVALAKQKQEQNIYELVDLMLKMDCAANFGTFLDYVFPRISTQDISAVVQKFKDQGYTVGAVVSPLVEYLVTQNDIKAACDLLEAYPVRCNASSLAKPLALAYNQTHDVDSTVLLLQKIRGSTSRDMERNSKIDWAGHCLLDYARILGDDVQPLESLLKRMSAMEFGLSPATVEILPNIIRNRMTANLESLLESLKSSAIDSHREFVRSGLPHPREMSIEELESHLIELKAKNMNAKGVLRQLLIEHARNKNVDRMEEIKKELDDLQFVYTSAAYAQMMGAYVQNNKFEPAVAYFELLKQQPDFLLDDHKLLGFASLLVREGKVDDAYCHLSEVPINYSSTRTTEPNCWRLLNAVAETGDVETTEKFLDVLVKRKLCEVSNVILGPMIKVHIVNNDLTGAVNKFEELCKTHRCSPMKNLLFLKLIEAEDSASLQKVMDLNTEIHGEINTLYDLAFSFLEANRFKEAQKILETPGLRAKHARLDNKCERLIEENQIDQLEQLVSITKELFDVDRDRMYFYLLKAYGRVNDHVKALNVWTNMQEEDVQPSAQTMIYLAKLLKENNQPVPFTVPEVWGQEIKAISEINEENSKQSVYLLYTPMLRRDLAQGLNQVLLKSPTMGSPSNPPADASGKTAVGLEGLPTVDDVSRTWFELCGQSLQSLPRKIPSAPSVTRPRVTKSRRSSVSITAVEGMIKQGRLDDAIDLKRRLEADGNTLSTEDTSSLIEGLIHAERLIEALNLCTELLDRQQTPRQNVFKFLILTLARGGDVSNLKSLEPKLTENIKKAVKFNSAIFNAHINSGSHLEALESLEMNVPGTIDGCPTGGLLNLLRKHKDLESRVEKLALEYTKHNFHSPINMVWMNYFMNEEYDKADMLFKTIPKFQDVLLFRSVVDHAKNTENVPMLQRLQDVVKSTKLPAGCLASVYSAAIELQCNLNKYEDAAKSLEMTKADGVHSLIRRDMWAAVKEGLASQGKTIPSNLIPTEFGSETERRRAKVSSSSSSSSSESDSDTGKKSRKVAPV